jgi:putative peptidoglycan lipid II flippase
VLAAGVLQLAVQMPALRRYGLSGRRPGAAGLTAEAAAEVRARVRAVLTTSAPLALGAAVYQVNVMVDGWMAQAMLTEGGPSTYHYATRIQQFPVALIATAATSSVFPSLQALAHVGRRQELRDLHDRAQLAVAYLAIPATLGLVALASPISAVLLQHGRFELQGVERTSAALGLLALSILPAGAAGLASRIYYALGDMATPVKVSVACLALNVVLNAVLVAGLGMDTGGFALATATSSWVNLALLLPGLSRRLGLPRGQAAWTTRIGWMTLAAGVSPAAAWGVWRLGVGGGAANGLRGAAFLGGAIAASVALYALASAWLALPEWRAITARLASRLGR